MFSQAMQILDSVILGRLVRFLIQMSLNTDMTLFTQSPAGYLSVSGQSLSVFR